MSTPSPESSRRDFLTGRSVLRQAEAVGEQTAEALLDSLESGEPQVPSGGDTIRLQSRAMNCEFAVILNPGSSDWLLAASQALDLIHQLEDQMTVYRTHSEMSRLNARAADEAVGVESRLFSLLADAQRLSHETGGAFDPTSGPLVALWRRCRDEGRIPKADEIECARSRCGMALVTLDHDARTVRFDRPGVELNFGAIGKGHALDRAAELLESRGVAEFLLSGGQSSLLSRGDHNQAGGWPVGLRNPAFPSEHMATLLLKNVAISTSGAGEQFYRYEGRRYGHILDPRTGWPAEGALSVTVLAPTAAEADALSTAFFAGGVEIARRYCDNHPEVGVLFTPPLRSGRTVEMVAGNVPEGVLYPGRGCVVTGLEDVG